MNVDKSDLDSHRHQATSFSLPITYDYIVLGAGSAGCVLAHRLSEDPSAAVLLIEAGGADKSWDLHIPAAFSRLYRSRYDWAYSTEAQTKLNNRQVYVPRGKVLGGSSSINAMIYTRGNQYDYDLWRDRGNPGWGFFDVLPYFKRAENHEGGEFGVSRGRRTAQRYDPARH